jgi:hypothetical protein
MNEERCAICQCRLHRRPGTYALHNTEGRNHATAHHFVAERFFGRSSNRRGTKTEGIFSSCPWGIEGQFEIFCYECHEELLHNPVLLPQDIRAFAELARKRGLSEDEKTVDRNRHAGRLKLLHEVIAAGIAAIEAGQQ